jgi:hypothetical protein
LLYRRITLQRITQMRALADVLLTLGSVYRAPTRWTRSLTIFECGLSTDLPGYLGALAVLLLHMTGLVEFDMTTRAGSSMALSLLQYSGRSRLARLKFAVDVHSPELFILASRFHNLQELQLQLHESDNMVTEVETPAWTLPRLADLRVQVEYAEHIDKEALFRFFSRCNLPSLRRFSWINSDDSMDTGETSALAEFLLLHPSVTELELDVEDVALALPHAACVRVILIDPWLPLGLAELSLSPRIAELVLDCYWEGYFKDSVPGLWRFLDAILDQKRDTDALHRIAIAKITKEGSFGWHDQRHSDDEVHMAETLATYVPKLKRQGIILLDGHGIELDIQAPLSAAKT